MKNKATKLFSSDKNNGSLHSYFKISPKDQAKQLSISKQLAKIVQSTNASIIPMQQQVPTHKFDQENSQFAINFERAQQILKNKQIQVQMDHNADTICVTQKMSDFKKIKVDLFNEQQTVFNNGNQLKKVIQKQIKQQAQILDQTQKKVKQVKQKKIIQEINVNSDKKSTIKIQIPKKSEVQKILQKQPLRVRLSGLLNEQQKYQIGHQNLKLLRILRIIDDTIMYKSNFRSQKSFYFYAQIKKNLYESVRTQISLKIFQQLLFLDKNLFKLQWQMNQKLKDYDILIRVPEIKSEDQRVKNVRKCIVKYLMANQIQYIALNPQKNKKHGCWAQGFNPNNYQIPLTSLPEHPKTKQSQIGHMKDRNILNIKNPNLKNLLMSKKSESDAKSLCSQDISNMIFNKKNKGDIKTRIQQTIRIKQQKVAMMASAAANSKISKQIILNVVDESMMLYLAKGVTNIFKTTLVETLNKKLSYKGEQIQESINILLNLKQIQFMKSIITSSKIEVIQLNRIKYNDVKEQITKSY